jgi:ABC-type nitrate/sulfonate/bicarbonate transport system ATPase subunit
MAQRTALARALVNMPDILLLDEPFTALDLHTRFRLQDELLGILRQTDTTIILVTHDIDEALYLADRILVMTRRPGSVKSVHSITTPKPRRRTAPDLMNLRTILLDELMSS